LEKVELSLLLRIEMADAELLPLMPRIGFNYQVLKNEQFYFSASISRNYNLPTLNDLYWYPGGNKELKAESGIEVESGLNFSKTLNTSFHFQWL